VTDDAEGPRDRRHEGRSRLQHATKGIDGCGGGDEKSDAGHDARYVRRKRSKEGEMIAQLVERQRPITAVKPEISLIGQR